MAIQSKIKCVFQMNNLRTFGLHPDGSINLDHIKSRLKIRRVLLEPKQCGSPKTFLFLPTYKFPRCTKIFTFPELDFHKNQILPVLTDQIDFSMTAAIIAGNDLISFLFQILSRQLLAPRSEQIILRHRTSSKMSCDEPDKGHSPAVLHNAAWFHIPYVPKTRRQDTFHPTLPKDGHGSLLPE